MELAEFALSLPSALKISRANSKITLRQAFESAWNEEVATNYKRGFGSPIEKWLRTPAFRNLAGDFLTCRDRKIHEIIRYEPSSDFPAPLTYNLLVLSLWMEQNSFAFPAR